MIEYKYISQRTKNQNKELLKRGLIIVQEQEKRNKQKKSKKSTLEILNPLWRLELEIMRM